VQAVLGHCDGSSSQASSTRCGAYAGVPTRTTGQWLEALTGDRTGQYSIRVNDQFRLCFRWTEVGPEDVEIVDYH